MTESPRSLKGPCQSDEACPNPRYARGLCRKHYTRWYRGKRMTQAVQAVDALNRIAAEYPDDPEARRYHAERIIVSTLPLKVQQAYERVIG